MYLKPFTVKVTEILEPDSDVLEIPHTATGTRTRRGDPLAIR